MTAARRWTRGQAAVEDLLATGRLETIAGAAANGDAHVDRAREFLESAEVNVATRPTAATVNAYDAARHACVAVLSQQGLRAKGEGHHLTVQQAVVAQFGGEFTGVQAMRRRRVELEYPTGAADEEDSDSASRAVDRARKIIEAADALLPSLGFFQPDPRP